MQFLSEMAKRHEDWQVKQADTALRLYDYYLSKNVRPAIDEASSFPPISRNGNPFQNLQTTMIYTHVAKKNVLGVRSPLDKPL